MIDLVTLSFLVLGAVGAGGVILHYAGYIPRPYRERLERTETTLATNLQALPMAIGLEVEAALNRVAVQQEANLGSGVDEVQQAQDALLARLDGVQASVLALPAAFGVELRKLAEEQEAKMIAEAASVVKSAEMSMVRGVGVDRQMQAKVSAALSEAILGPALPILRQFAPGLADMLEENPQLVDVVIQNPLFIKYVAPRLQQFLGTKSAPTDTGNPFGEMGR